MAVNQSKINMQKKKNIFGNIPEQGFIDELTRVSNKIAACSYPDLVDKDEFWDKRYAKYTHPQTYLNDENAPYQDEDKHTFRFYSPQFYAKQGIITPELIDLIKQGARVLSIGAGPALTEQTLAKMTGKPQNIHINDVYDWILPKDSGLPTHVFNMRSRWGNRFKSAPYDLILFLNSSHISMRDDYLPQDIQYTGEGVEQIPAWVMLQTNYYRLFEEAGYALKNHGEIASYNHPFHDSMYGLHATFRYAYNFKDKGLLYNLKKKSGAQFIAGDDTLKTIIVQGSIIQMQEIFEKERQQKAAEQEQAQKEQDLRQTIVSGFGSPDEESDLSNMSFIKSLRQEKKMLSLMPTDMDLEKMIATFVGHQRNIYVAGRGHLIGRTFDNKYILTTPQKWPLNMRQMRFDYVAVSDDMNDDKSNLPMGVARDGKTGETENVDILRTMNYYRLCQKIWPVLNDGGRLLVRNNPLNGTALTCLTALLSKNYTCIADTKNGTVLKKGKSPRFILSNTGLFNRVYRGINSVEK